jgi:hypothetical protein
MKKNKKPFWELGLNPVTMKKEKPVIWGYIGRTPEHKAEYNT